MNTLIVGNPVEQKQTDAGSRGGLRINTWTEKEVDAVQRHSEGVSARHLE